MALEEKLEVMAAWLASGLDIIPVASTLWPRGITCGDTNSVKQVGGAGKRLTGRCLGPLECGRDFWRH